MTTRVNQKLVFLVVVALTAASAADLPSAWRFWRYSRAIQAPHADALNYITLDREVFSHSENQLADVRVIDDSGQQFPYEMRTQITPPPEPVRVSARLRENSFVPGQFTQVIVDLGERSRFHNSLRVETPESDFINWVQVAASDDAHVWRIVNPRAPISRFRRNNLEGDQTVRYAENNARYLRVRIAQAGDSFQVSNIEVFSSPITKSEGPAEGAPLVSSLAPDSGVPGSQTRWTVDLGSGNVPVAKFKFVTSQPDFYRAVRILASSDENEWQFAGGGEIHRYLAGGKAEESLAVPCYEPSGQRYWRVEVLNASDAPLSAVRISAVMPLRFVLFHPAANRSYRLIYGNPRANAPQYDLARTLQIPALEAMFHPSLGPEEPTSNYADARPFTERHPNLLWIALGMAVILLGYAALRAFSTPSPADGEK